MTLLLVVYEILQGNFEAADGLLNCGLQVLRNSLILYHNVPVSGLEVSISKGTPNHEQVLPCFAMSSDYSSHLTSKWASVLFIQSDSLLHFLDLGIASPTSSATNWSEFRSFASERLGEHCALGVGGSDLLAGCSLRDATI